jgi:CheY-like chemotaxis protein
VLLDLNSPRMNGIELLDEIRKDSALKDSIVFVLTTSNTAEDKVAAYEKQVAGYIVKEKAGKDFAKLTCMLENYWRVIEFPPQRT